MPAGKEGLYIILISLHGLIRARDPELGRDADTGGQTKYVLELMRTLAKHPAVSRVDLLTRQIHDPKVGPDYSVPLEQVAPNAWIVRLACGPRRYLRKEVLWPHLDTFADQALRHVRSIRRAPDVIHAHYADAGYVGVQLASLLEAPLVFTGHSLGHVKRERLLAKGLRPESIEGQYHMSQRIEAENIALDNAALVVASTQQEVAVQYSRYDNYQPARMVVIPPGIDLERFHPPLPEDDNVEAEIRREIERFLADPTKPMILALARPDPRKNLAGLVRAYAETPGLRELANLVLIAGTRDDVLAMEKGPRRVLSEIMFLVDRFDLYGHVAYPKQHRSEDVPRLYRWAALTRGVFVNPALTEPFGLTLLEAAASGLPIVATNDGGPQDIIKYCRNGRLIDPLDTVRLGATLYDALGDRRRWRRWSQAGILGAKRHFSWEGHVITYLDEIDRVLEKRKRRRLAPSLKSKLPVCDRILVCDIDNTLIGDGAALTELLRRLDAAPNRIGFGIATGRRLDSAVKVLREWRVPEPDFFITAAGSEIHYGPQRVDDDGWFRHIDFRWEPERVRAALRGTPGLRVQPKEEQRQYKISYYVDPERAPSLREITRLLRRQDIHVNVIYSHQAFLDLLPVRASKGAAVRYFAGKWGIPYNHILAAGDSGNDEEMLSGATLGVVVGNHSTELERLRGHDRIYFADGHHAWGILEGIAHYDFLGSLRGRGARLETAEAVAED